MRKCFLLRRKRKYIGKEEKIDGFEGDMLDGFERGEEFKGNFINIHLSKLKL